MKIIFKFLILFCPFFTTTLAELFYNTATYSQLISSLKFNESCSWSNEKIRLRNKKNMVTLIATDRINALQKFNKYAERVVKESIHFCSKIDKLVCDRLTQRCRCGKESREIFPRNGSAPLEYVREIGAGGQERCHWAEGSYCFWKEEQWLGRDGYIRCEDGTECLGVVDGLPCSLVSGTVRRYRLTIRSQTDRRLYRDLFLLKVCTCRRVSHSNNTSSTSPSSRFETLINS